MTMKPMPLARRLRAGFTLLEMLMVIALIALLATVGIVALSNLFEKGSEGVAKAWVTTTAKTALVSYRLATGHYPTTEEGLNALINPPERDRQKLKGKLLETSKIPDDPWGNPYKYRFPGTKNPTSYDVFSYGPDRQEGTADDIGNWD